MDRLNSTWGETNPYTDRFNNIVCLIHEDGTSMTIQNSFLERDPEDNYIWVISEHQDPLAIHADDLYLCKELKPVKEYWNAY